jgi:hypothetical protein
LKIVPSTDKTAQHVSLGYRMAALSYTSRNSLKRKPRRRYAGDRPAAMRSALMKFNTRASFGRYSRANVVLPAPLGPAMRRHRGTLEPRFAVDFWSLLAIYFSVAFHTVTRIAITIRCLCIAVRTAINSTEDFEVAEPGEMPWPPTHAAIHRALDLSPPIAQANPIVASARVHTALRTSTRAHGSLPADRPAPLRHGCSPPATAQLQLLIAREGRRHGVPTALPSNSDN